MDSIYIETSVFGYLASRMSSDLVTAGNQRLTRDWWDNHRELFDLFISQAVVAECSAGDGDAAKERLVFVAGLPILDITDEARSLAQSLLSGIPLPENADVDALHIANPSLRRIIDKVLIAADVSPPIICTPQELIHV